MTDSVRMAPLRAFAFLGFMVLVIPALGWLPYRFPVAPDVFSVASHVGYNGKAAYIAFVILSVLTVIVSATRSQADSEDWEPARSPGKPPMRIRIAEVAIVFAAVILLYWPQFLARYGPYIEDNLYLSLLHRMNGGQRPYADFEFLYGPLLIYPQHWWMSLFGFSMKSYYAFQALMEAIVYSLLLWILQSTIPAFRKRIFIFAVISIFLFNTVLGMNYNGLRRLLPLLGLIWLAARSDSWKVLVCVSILYGLLLAYSHELAAAALLAGSAMFVLTWLRTRESGSLARAAAMWGIALFTWQVTIFLVLAELREAYYDSTLFLLERFTAGEQAFPFRWTLNTLCAFALFGIACVSVGSGLRPGRTGLLPGDRLLFMALVYALVGLRAGLNRSDIWHLTPPFLAIVLAFLWPMQRSVFRISRGIRTSALALILVMSLTYALSLAPFGSFYARGLYRGLIDSLRGVQRSAGAATRAPSIEKERSHPDPDVLRLGEYLAVGEMKERSVLFYSRLWSLDKRTGVYGSVYLPDDFFMTDAAGVHIARFVQHRKPVVIMQEPVYRHLFETVDSAEYEKYLDRQPMTVTKKILAWLSTPFFADLPLEWKLKEDRWKRTVAPSLAGYRRETDFGQFVVLLPK